MTRRRVSRVPEPPEPRRADSQQIVEAIIAAAIELGPNSTTNEIAERAGVGIASLYRYFPSVVAIYAEISRRLLRKFLTQLREITVREDLDLPAAIREVCRVAVVGPEVSIEVRQRLNLDVPLSWTKASTDDVYRTAITEMAAWLHQHLDRPPADLSERVFMAFASVRGAILLSMLYPDLAPSTERLVEQLATVMLGFLTGTTA